MHISKYSFFIACTFCIASFSSCITQKVNQLSSSEKKAGWVTLFDGKSFDGWRQYNNEGMPANWVVEDGAMKVFTGEGKKLGRGAGGDIIYALEKYDNFELSIEWKASKMANSGIFYYVQEIPNEAIYYAAPEIQVLDNEYASDNKVDSHRAGSLYDMIAADPKTVKAHGEWNKVVVRIKDGKASHIMNGEEVVSYTLWTEEWDEMVNNSKFRKFPGFTSGIAKEGFIGLQDHGHTVWFRNIKIRKL